MEQSATVLISILVPFKNTQDFLEECLVSIIEQGYPHWEVLAVDDHSNDNSVEIVRRFSQSDPRIKLYPNKGHGIIEALRTAYDASRGTLITRMDSDDVMVKDKLQVMAYSLQARGPGHVAIGQVRYFSDRGISNGYERYEQWLNQLTERGSNYGEIYKECVIPSPCWMVYRNDLDACGAFDPDRYPEDYDLTFRFYEKGLRCIPCDQVLHLWRDYDTRTSRTSEHYAQNYFLDIKLHYFLRLDRDPKRTLTLWGAGSKGKEIAKGLIKKKVEFHWLCDNPNKIGKEIYGKHMYHYSKLKELPQAQSIITVANEEAQAMIRAYFAQMGQQPMTDYFFFC
ncbi:glycosyltransferase [Pseudozobellia thermophila]|uniref:Glycosyl transferase family 2 n=1 Tax=Pseudozobellia thermophila TaxID=192903 RepID=A0A1M6L7U5_9FLAO|nr:glycosyltransferase [Pseudozobellia thermophila]SHJ67234.1 Glycosyl transferase family 2 [Pseudozobellia thermophila]